MQKYAHIDPVTRNIIVPGNLYVEGSANIPGLQPADISPVSTTDIVGNIISGQYVSVSGNVKGRYLLGNGTFLNNLIIEVPGNITADIVGNISGPKITLTGNMSATSLVGNASMLLGVVVGFPTTGVADVRGNVFAPGNVNAANVGASNFIIYGNAFTNTNSVTGNVTASYFSGNGIFLTDVVQTFPSSAAIDIIGNVLAPANVNTITLTTGNVIVANAFMNTMNITGNIMSSYFSGNAANVTGAIPASLNTNVFGNVYATGNIMAAYFNGNGQGVTLDGYTIIPRGNVANQIARLALSNAIPGSLVFQTDANVTYILLGTPASSTSNWLQFTGANFPVTSVMGRTGNVLLLSNVDVKTIGGANIAAPGSLTTANINVIGNVTGKNVTANVVTSGNVSTGTIRTDAMTVTGNVVVNYLVGNGMLLESVQLTIPRTANIDIVGNVVASANVDTQSITTTVMRAGNVIVTGQANVVGNVSAAYFVGNGSTITGISVTGTQPINIIGNVFATGNVNAANVSTGVLIAGNAIMTGQINTIGNVVTNAFFVGGGAGLTNVPAIVTGTQNINITGNVISSGNVDASNVSTGILRASNVIVNGQVNSTGNVVANYFIGSGAQLSNVTATLGGTQVVDIIGNVVASANVDASNVSTSLLRVAGNIIVLGQVNTLGNIVGSNFFGSGSGLTGVTAVATGNQTIDITGNVSATANVDASNVTASIVRVVGNGVVGGQVNVIGNVIASRLLGNGILLSGVVTTGNITVDIVGNVIAIGNVNTQNVVTTSLRTSSNCIVTGQVNVSGNIVADGGFVGDGSLLQGTTFGATGSPLPSFVPPVTGFTVDVGNVIYSNTAGWTIPIQQYQTTNIRITTYNMPTNPDSPFVNLPSTVTQRLNSPWVFSNGVWSGNVNLFSTATFASQPISMGYNSGYGILGGNSSATNGTGIQMISLNGVFQLTNTSGAGWCGDVWPNPDTGNLWVFILPNSNTYILGQYFIAGQIYFLEMTKNLNYLVSWHQVTSVSPVGATTFAIAGTQAGNYYIASATEAYLFFAFAASNGSVFPIVYDTVCVPNNRTYYTCFVARVNPTARTCQWSTCIVGTNGVNLNITNSLSLNPQKTIFYLQSVLQSGGSSYPMIVGNTTGANIATFTIPSTSRQMGMGIALFPGNGNYIPNTFSGVYNSTFDSLFALRLVQNSDIWSADGQVAYTCWSSTGSQSMILGTWNMASNTWTVRSTIAPQQVNGTGGFTSQPFIYRLPVGNVNATWSGATITTTRDTFGSDGRQPQVQSITPANNGNVFIFAQSTAINTAITATSTWGTATTSVPAGTLYSPPQVFSFQDTNGTFSNYGALTGTSSAVLGRAFGGVNQWNGITSVKVPNSNTSVRVMSSSDFNDLTLNGVAASNLNPSGSIYVPAMFDINSALTISNFMGQSPFTNSNVVSAFVTSPTIYFGPNADYNYHIVGCKNFGAAKMGNV
uniref:Vp260 like protein n=1 Tax=Chlorella virus TaxID=10507 RepID=Q8V7K0_9PHYC|nr:Vp260 like protein [Chlorella virus]